jgi:hypothetical protein
MKSISRPLALAALFASALTFSQTAAAQEARAAADESKAPAAVERRRLAVEVVEADGSRGPLFAVPDIADDSYAAEISPPRRIDGGKRPEGEPPLTRIRLRISYEGDAVRIKVIAVLDDSWPPDAPGPKYGPKEKAVGSYLAREGETLRVEGLKGFGFEPLVLAVSEAKPEPEMPFMPAPARAFSRLKSIEVVSFTTEGAEMERARLVLRNVSPKNIVGLEMGSDGGINMMQTFGPRPLIESGATYETETGSGRGGRVTAGGGYEPAPQPEALVVGAAVFEDGSYEGDAKAAATMLARQKGRSAQFARVLKLLQDALGAEGLDTPGALARLKSRVGGLRIDVEPSALDELVARFPEIPRDECRRYVAGWAVDGLKMARGESLSLLEKVEGARARKAEGFDLRRQLEDMRAVVEKRAGVRRD